MKPPVPLVATFDSPSASAAELGGKGASLCRLVTAGHRVPPGFVVGVAGFVATLEHLTLTSTFSELSAALAGRGDLLAPGKRIAEGLARGRLPPALLDAVERAVAALRLWEGDGASLIVRSSATAEDGAASSFAGIFESIPIASPDALEPTIREVFASAFTPRALTYARERGLTSVPAMAVVVQRFLEATRSGVMFTRFRGPGGADAILVEHVEGGCEKLVKGEVTPERLWMPIGSRDAPIGLEGPLAAEHAGELARLAADLEAAFGGPQDVEWVVWRDEVHLVQSRPITAGAGASAELEGEAGAEPLLCGVPASPGAGAGPVHVGFNVDQVLELPPGAVLVTPMTNPDMVVAMRNSAAIVTDVGGMICHAAIVSRELGLPCVVGTERATRDLVAGQTITVDGTRGAVYAGRLASPRQEKAPARAMGFDDLWVMWAKATAGRADVAPIASTLRALEAAPLGLALVGLVPDLDLCADEGGLWRDLDGMPEAARDVLVDAYLRRVDGVAADRGIAHVLVVPRDIAPRALLERRIAEAGLARVALHAKEPAVVRAIEGALPANPALIPLGSVARLLAPSSHDDGAPPTTAELMGRAADVALFFGHRPASKRARMPDEAWRARWRAHLPAFDAFHREHPERREGEYDWLELRPEIVISALLKSVVLPGFEMIPRYLGLEGLGPMHIKWIRCRYHLRADTFAKVWAAVVHATWDEAFMTRMLRDVRASYARWQARVATFPKSDAEWGALSGAAMVDLAHAWWPELVEFFSLNWFEQAQGDDIAYPFIEAVVRENLAALGAPPDGFAWPGPASLVAPTQAVVSGEYVEDVSALRRALDAAGLASRDAAIAAIDAGDSPVIAAMLARHLAKWAWMRDRDLLFPPWDTRERVLDTALRTEPHAPPRYAENLAQNLLATSFHFDLAEATGRARELHHAIRFLQDLRLERENHHLMWLRCSHGFRRLAVEIERRLVATGSLAPGDVFFLQMPELLDAAASLPAPLDEALIAKVKSRRAGYLREARLPPVAEIEPRDEDDYY
jgi:pyruvate,water dikinase